MSFRDTDDLRTYAFLGALERLAKSAPELSTKTAAMNFGGMYGGGYNGGPLSNFWGDGSGTVWGQLLPGTQYDYVQEAGDLWMNSAVAICLGWIADNFSEPVLRAYERRQEEVEERPIPNDPCVEVLENPNPDYDADALWAATILSFLVCGNAFWIKAKSPGGVKMYLYYVPHWEMEVRWKADGSDYITHYVHVVDGRRQPIAKEDVVHFRNGLDPRNTRSGRSPLMPTLREICADNWGATYSAAILRNMGVAGVMITPEADDIAIDPDDAENLKQLWSERTTGDNVGKPIVSSLRMKIQELTISPEKMALDVIRRIPEARICAALKIPPTVVGLSVGEDQRTYANQASDERKAYRNCLIPLQKCFAKILTKYLLPDFDKVSKPLKTSKRCLRWDYSNVEAMQEERDAVSKRTMMEYEKGGISQEETRARLGLGLAKKGDTFVLPRGATTYKFGEDPIVKPATGLPGGEMVGNEQAADKDDAEKPSDDEDSTATESDDEEDAKPKNGKASRNGKVASKKTGAGVETKTVLNLDDFDRTDAEDFLHQALAAHGLGAAYLAGTITDTQRHVILGEVCDRVAALIKEITGEFIRGHLDSTKAETIGPLFDAGLKAWMRRMRKLVGAALLAGALALLGPKSLDADDTANLDTARDAQMVYLAGFEAAVRSGDQKMDGTMPARAASYGAAAWQVAENLARDRVLRTAAAAAITVAAGRQPKTTTMVQFEQRFTTSNIPCVTCSDEAARGMQPLGTLRSLGDSECYSRCRCYYVYTSVPVAGPIPSPSEMPIELPPEPIFPTHGVITIGPHGPVDQTAQLR